MSRCFPFPPPGYVKKARTDDVDFLKKEKQKEKKHKKEKDKEKKENKEKKEKDRSDGKHKDKKDKKEKHKDKKKDRDKEKDRSNNSDEGKFPGHPEGQNVEKLLDETKHPGKSEVHSGEKFIQKEKGKDKDRSNFSGEKRLAGQFLGYNGEKISQNSHLADNICKSKFVQEFERRVRHEGAEAANELAVDKVMGVNRKRDEGVVRLVAKTVNALAEEKEKNKKSDDRKLDIQQSREETRSSGNAMVQNLAGTVKAKVEGIPRQLDSNMERRAEGKEKTKEKGSDNKSKDKRKDKDREKKSHGKNRDSKKEAAKAKAKAKGEHRNLEQNNLKGSSKDDPMGTINLKTSQPSRDADKGAVAEDNHCKRKDLERNGFLHVNEIKPNKLARTSSSHPLTDNGRTLESQPPIPNTSESQLAGSSLKVINKETKVNGMIEAQLLPVSPIKQLSASAQASKREEESMKPPHPDSKYLSEILSVPKMEDWSDFDDQSWLFHSNESQTKNPKVGSSDIDEAPQVWAEALQIELADICALPYVIPY